MTKKITLILVPSETPFLNPVFFRFSPLPLSLGVLQGYLRAGGFTVSSTDLNTCMHVFANQPDARQWLPLFDKDLVLRHLTEAVPTGMEKVLDYFIQKTEAAGSDIVGISTGANMSFFEIHLAFLLGCRIKVQMGKTVVFGGANIDFLWQFREVFQELWAALAHNSFYVFTGPGERSFAKLIAGLGQPEEARSFRELPGAVYLENGQVVRNHEDLPTLTRPDFKGLHLKHYTLCGQVVEPTAERPDSNLVHFYQMPIHLNPAISELNRRKLPGEKRKETL